MLNTTVGQIMANEPLPPEMRDYTRVLDSKGVKQLLREVADKYPDKYRDIAKQLSDVGRDVAYTSGSQSFGLEHMRPTAAVNMSRMRLNLRMRNIMESNIPDDKKQDKIVEAASAEHERLLQEIQDETKLSGNPLGDQVRSGSRGKPSELKQLIGGPGLYVDHRDNVIPFPVQTSFAEGLRPAEFWASSFGARKGLIAVKFATQDAGYFSKQLNQVAHRLLVTELDDENPYDGIPRGLPVNVNDADNDGALLAFPAGGYKRNATLTTRILKDLEGQGIKRILVRSPIVGGPAAGGVYARDVGIREKGQIAPLGDMVGLAAAQALSEKLTQGQLGAKHTGGRKGESKSVSGFARVNQLVQVPKTFKGGATHAQVDGRVTLIDDAPAGGKYITVSGTRHYVPPGYDINVKRGDDVEAGDVLTGGMPNPAEIVKYKGVGEGRRYFVDAFAEAYRDSGMPYNRRNIELVSRGLINHVEAVDEDDEHIPGDIMPYQEMEAGWRPRPEYQTLRPHNAIGKYLERPILHYTVGTPIKPSMISTFKEFGVDQIDVHDDPPPFQPVMVRAMASIGNDPDWMVRFLGSNQKKSLLEATHRGAASDTTSTSFVPAMAAGLDFGKTWPQSVLKPPKT